MKTQRRKRRIGLVLFFVPILVLTIGVAYAILSSNYGATGTLIVSTQTSGKYYRPIWLNVTVQVGTSYGTSPLHLPLRQGVYTVHYPQEPWFYGPPDRAINVPAGQISYAVGVYDPIVKTIAIQNSQFNSTFVTALHGITPVVFINMMNGYAVIQSDQTGRSNIRPGGNFTYIFPQPGDFSFGLPLVGSPIVTISVR